MPIHPYDSRDDKIMQVLFRHPLGGAGLTGLVLLAVCLAAWGPGTDLARANPLAPTSPADAAANFAAPLPTVTLDPLPVLPATNDPPALPTVTPTPAIPLQGEEVLSPELQQNLYAASLAYVADSPEEAIPIAHSLGFAQGHGDPTSMCGPLAIAILRDAGLISKYTDPQDFWLWSPAKNPQLAEITFPADRFSHQQFLQPLNEFDFKAFPLKPGDFLYIYAGKSGTYEHMLVVTRVDAAGRAYAVTNLKTNDGFVDREVMLYDPQQPGVGQFYDWTDRRNFNMGLTGFGGFEVWRVTSLPPQPDPQERSLADALDHTIAQYGGIWNILIKAANGPVIYSRRADDPIQVASVIRVPIAMLFFKSLEANGLSPDQYDNYLLNQGPDRSYSQLLNAMLVHSEEDATSLLLQETRQNGLNINLTLGEWGITKMNLDSRVSTASQVASLLDGLYSGNFLQPEGRAAILNRMDSQGLATPSHLGILRSILPAGSELYEMRGTIIDEQNMVCDAAILSLPAAQGQRAYVVTIFGYGKGSSTNNLNLIQAIDQMANAIWVYISSSP